AAPRRCGVHRRGRADVAADPGRLRARRPEAALRRRAAVPRAGRPGSPGPRGLPGGVRLQVLPDRHHPGGPLPLPVLERSRVPGTAVPGAAGRGRLGRDGRHQLQGPDARRGQLLRLQQAGERARTPALPGHGRAQDVEGLVRVLDPRHRPGPGDARGDGEIGLLRVPDRSRVEQRGRPQEDGEGREPPARCRPHGGLDQEHPRPRHDRVGLGHLRRGRRRQGLLRAHGRLHPRELARRAHLRHQHPAAEHADAQTAPRRGTHLPRELPQRLVPLRDRPRDVQAREDDPRGLHHGHAVRVRSPVHEGSAPRPLPALAQGDGQPAYVAVRVPRRPGLAARVRADPPQPPRALRLGCLPRRKRGRRQRGCTRNRALKGEQTMKRLVLINAYPDKHFGEENIWVIVQMPLNLAYIAALTPRDEWEVDVIDETLERAVDAQGNLTFGRADLVGITAVTYQVPRLYEIAEACRRAGVPTIAGGAHATILPEEASTHVDSEVVGEAERVWRQVLADFERGSLQPTYHGGPTPLEELKDIHPDREWLRDKYRYKYSSIITTRGCPFKCDFCCVPFIQGRKYRQRPPEDVWNELANTDYRGLMLAEANFYGYTPDSQESCRKLFKGWAERDLKKNWFGFTSLNVTQDDVVLDYMAKSGCLGILMGIESLDYDTLKRMHKSVNIGIAKKASTSFLDSYRHCFGNLHRHGLIVWSSVI